VVFGFLKKKKERQQVSTGDLTRHGQIIEEPIGEWTDDGYVPDPRELANAVPLPEYALGGEEALNLVNEEEYGWVLLNTKSWRPCRPKNQRGRRLARPVRLPGKPYEYHAMVWHNGKIYLVDGFTWGLLYDSDCKKSAAEVLEGVMNDYLKGYEKDHPLRRAFETGENKDLAMNFIAAAYLQFALLRHYGLLY